MNEVSLVGNIVEKEQGLQSPSWVRVSKVVVNMTFAFAQ